MNAADPHHLDWSQLNGTGTSSTTSLLDSLTNSYSGPLVNENISMQKSINGSSLFDSRLPSANNNAVMNGHQQQSLNSNHLPNNSRIQLDHQTYQKHQPAHTQAGKLAITKLFAEQQSNHILKNNQQSSTLLKKKHVYANSELDPLNLFHLPEQQQQDRNRLDSNPQVIGSYEQAKNEQQMLNYYSKALMLTIVAGIVMFTLNISIFIILIGKKRKIKQVDSRQKQTAENDEQQQQSQKQLQQTADHHLKMINNEELAQYDDYLEMSKNSVYNLQQNAVTLHEQETDLKWYTTINHNEPGLNVANWSNNYLLFEQHPATNDLASYTSNALTNIDLNTLTMSNANFDTCMNGTLNGTNYSDTTYSSNGGGHYEREASKLSTSIKQHLNETDI